MGTRRAPRRVSGELVRRAGAARAGPGREGTRCNNITFGDLVCKSFIERTVWDGDQILIENRTDGAAGLSSSQLDQEFVTAEAYGQMISLHADGIDAPVAVRKTGGTTLTPHENWRGDYEIGTTANGTPTSLCNGGPGCPVVNWPGGQVNADGREVTHPPINTWWGNLITDKLDASALNYMRNRYYNPASAQFTQQDPIGLGGGASLYGYAGGDPINFGDPLGLKVCISPDDYLREGQQALEDATDTRFNVDRKGCVDASSIEGRGQKGFAALQARFRIEALDEDETFYLRYETGSGSETIGSHVALMTGDLGVAYATPGEHCARNFNPTLGAIVAHELFGHAFGFVYGKGKDRGGTREAIRVENIYHTARGEPQRDPNCGDGP